MQEAKNPFDIGALFFLKVASTAAKKFTYFD
jgi:hypothetical protein